VIGVVVLRPEPGNAATAARLEAAGLTAIRQPIFEAREVNWLPPDPDAFDALLVTSAQAVRLAGEGLGALARLPVIAVGERTAAAARAAGLSVALTGEGDAADAIAFARDAGFVRLLHLAGRDRTETTQPIEAVTVYESVQTREPDIPPGAIVLLHSARAAQALAAASLDRAAVGVVAISPAVLAAAGEGWRTARAAATPTDVAMIEAARAIDPPPSNGDDAA
jgi:uroporphyrinogen-III synthase